MLKVFFSNLFQFFFRIFIYNFRNFTNPENTILAFQHELDTPYRVHVKKLI